MPHFLGPAKNRKELEENVTSILEYPRQLRELHERDDFD